MDPWCGAVAIRLAVSLLAGNMGCAAYGLSPGALFAEKRATNLRETMWGILGNVQEACWGRPVGDLCQRVEREQASQEILLTRLRQCMTGGLTWPVLIPLTYILGLALPRWPRYLLCSAEPSSSCILQTTLRHQFPFPTFPPRGRFEAASTWASSQAGMRCSLSTNGASY